MIERNIKGCKIMKFGLDLRALHGFKTHAAENSGNLLDRLLKKMDTALRGSNTGKCFVKDLCGNSPFGGFLPEFFDRGFQPLLNAVEFRAHSFLFVGSSRKKFVFMGTSETPMSASTNCLKIYRFGRN